MNEIKVIQSDAGKEIIVRVVHSRFDEDAWIGLFKAGSGDNEHGDRWKWMRDVDVSHITLPAQGAGEWSVRLFKDGGYKRISSLDFHVTNSHSSIHQPDAESNKESAIIAFVIGLIMFFIGLPLFIAGHGPPGEENLGMIIPGAIMFGVGSFVAIVAAAIGMGFGKRATTSEQDMAQQRRGSGIEILEAVPGNPVRFRINNRPSSNDAWVGIYPVNAKDVEHGDRWGWLRDKHMDNASLPGQTEGRWSIRVFSDGGYTLHDRVDFDIVHSQVAASKYREEFISISEYDEVWNDKGSRAKQDVSVWRPRLPAGCYRLGMTAKNGHSPPTFPTLVIRPSGSNIAPPERFDLVWWQERGRRRFWCWRPIPPPGYVSLGDVGTLSEHPPSPRDVVCVALEWLSPNKQPLGEQIWNDRGGGAPKDGAFFAQPGSTGLFRCSDDNTHNRPRGEFYLPGNSHDNTTQSQLQGEISLKSVHGKYLNATPEGRVEWDDDIAHVGEYFRVEQRQNGKIALKGAFDMYLSAQLDGSVECNRRHPGGWEEFTVEYRSNDVVCLKSCHGKYLSAQQDGTAQWNRDHAPIGGWEEIQIEHYRKTSEPILSEPILNSDQKYVFAQEHKGWHWHNERARAMGGHIASITSAEENEQITRISGGAPVWIGGIRKGARYRGKPIADRKPGDPGEVGPGAEDWYWSDGRPWSYTNWGPNEPNNWDAGENRVQHLGKFDAVWNDVGEDWDGPAVYVVPLTASEPSETSESSSRSSPEIDILAQFKSKLELSNSHLSRIEELSSKLKRK